MSSKARVRNVLHDLYKKIMKMKDDIPLDGHIDLANLRNVELIIGFDFEHVEKKSSQMCPPFHFAPMKPDQMEKYRREGRHQDGFKNIDQFSGTWDLDLNNIPSVMPMSPFARCQQISYLISAHATTQARSDRKLRVLDTLHYENFEMGYYNNRSFWRVMDVMEPQPEPKTGKIYPHLMLHLLGIKVAREDSILFSELSALVCAMRARANQRKVDSEDELMQLEETVGEGLEDYPFLFPDEEEFPVLLISCVLPQHARILAASMYQRTLVIRQSKLYSFEYRDDAPVDLFTRFFLSRPKQTVCPAVTG
ncbi:hypothetical protein AbraIFM66950_004743 [Aspergillus brasiliensis]|nr:hypothetical protein AbraIFM66950_004743 [Aspergillus brasiliensis]